MDVLLPSTSFRTVNMKSESFRTFFSTNRNRRFSDTLKCRRKTTSTELQAAVDVAARADNGSPSIPSHKVTVHDRERGVVHEFVVPENRCNVFRLGPGNRYKKLQDQYILHTAEAQSITLPFACRHGCCTSCAVRIKSGEIRQPEALGISAELKSKKPHNFYIKFSSICKSIHFLGRNLEAKSELVWLKQLPLIEVRKRKNNQELVQDMRNFLWERVEEDPSPSREFVFHVVWRTKVSVKVRFFIWKVLFGRVSTVDRLVRRSSLVGPFCSLLCQRAEEDHDHPFWDCHYTPALWSMLLQDFGVNYAGQRGVRATIELLGCVLSCGTFEGRRTIGCFVGYALLCVGFPSSDVEVETQDEDEERDDYALELAMADEPKMANDLIF
uniref:2Fe-2S ferredoxin-type domain-containing protein n=1 Tax=Cucumis melo TaxID=3656 RepID=A0A9I9CGT0_CUCME